MARKLKSANVVLIVFFTVLLVVQLVILFPLTIYNFFRMGPQLGIIAILFQMLIFLALYFGLSQAWSNYAK
ncbi:MAG: hypothetical protein ACMXYK_03230 [Candidatus Woesearchaeota archaeon]